MKKSYIFLILVALITGCNNGNNTDSETSMNKSYYFDNMYATVRLTADIDSLTDPEKQMLPKLIDAAKIMDDLFWIQAFGDKKALLDSIKDENLLNFAKINYGPWDRLNNNKPFIEGFGPKPAGANFYPAGITKDEFEKADLPGKESLYSLLRKDANGKLNVIPYHEFFATQLKKASDLLLEASGLAVDPGLKNYLKLRSAALLTDNYQPSDFAWLDMKNNTLDIVIGPIESYEDGLYEYKASYEAYVLIRDRDWSRRLEKYMSRLPELQAGLPVPSQYKKEKPGGGGDLNAYDVVYYAGDCNAGSKTIAINLPNDEEVQLKKGTRRLQLKNAMKAKFDKIMLPIAGILIDSSQLKYVTFNAFFANTMFHEVAHGLGIKNTINGKGTVRDALKEQFSTIEEGKADILGLYMIKQLVDNGVLEGPIEDYYTTFLAGIFRSVRFGASEAHGKANMIRFNVFKEMGAFDYNPDTDTYKVNFDKMENAIRELSKTLLVLEGDGNYQGAKDLIEQKSNIGPQLKNDLDKLEKANIPVDIVFEQGMDVLSGNN
jgi:hypothetical protein